MFIAVKYPRYLRIVLRDSVMYIPAVLETLFIIACSESQRNSGQVWHSLLGYLSLSLSLSLSIYIYIYIYGKNFLNWQLILTHRKFFFSQNLQTVDIKSRNCYIMIVFNYFLGFVFNHRSWYNPPISSARLSDRLVTAKHKAHRMPVGCINPEFCHAFFIANDLWQYFFSINDHEPCPLIRY